MKYVRWIIIMMLVAGIGFMTFRFLHQQVVLKEMIERLSAQHRVAQVLVTGVNYDERTKRNYTTIKFLEFDAQDKALEPKYFTFPAHIIQFQSLVVRFEDHFIKMGDQFRGKSVYLFLKVFALDGPNTKEFDITKIDDIPSGYKIPGKPHSFETQFWQKFWLLAFDAHYAKQLGVKNVQIEAPGTMFIPGYLYTINIEHDGGLRIDTQALPEILRGEKI